MLPPPLGRSPSRSPSPRNGAWWPSKAEAPAAAPGGDEAEKKRLKEQAKKRQKNRAEQKEKGTDRPALEKKNKELEANNLAGLKAANPDVTRRNSRYYF